MKTPQMRSVMMGAGLVVLAGCGTTVSEGKHGLQSDGSFRLTQAERDRSCASIRSEMLRLSDDTVLADTQTSQEVASSILYGVLFGVAGAATYRVASDAGAAGKRAKRNRAKLNALNDTLQAKGCATWNYQAHIKTKQAAVTAKYAKRRREKLESIR